MTIAKLKINSKNSKTLKDLKISVAGGLNAKSAMDAKNRKDAPAAEKKVKE
jgi:hypothetical protein